VPEQPLVAPAAPTVSERRHPLRFVWQMDAEDRFTIGSAEFIELIGPRSAAVLGRPWNEIAAELGLDPDGQIARAIASRDTWSGLTLAWPVDGGADRLSVELSGLPVFDRDRAFRGYRGFGVCRDLGQLAALTQARRTDAAPDAAAAAPEPVSSAQNVLPFRAPIPDAEAPTLSPVERRAFRELSLRLSERLGAAAIAAGNADAANTEQQVDTAALASVAGADGEDAAPDEKSILDRLPVGVLVYSLDHLLFANPAFLAWSRHDSLAALTEAGGLDSLLVEAREGAADTVDGQPLTVASERGDAAPLPARLVNTIWAGERVHALVLTPFGKEHEQAAAAAADLVRAELNEVRSILDTATDGVVVLDREGRILSCNRSAEALFGYEAHQVVGRVFVDLFAPESERVASDYLGGLLRDGVASLLNDGREVIGRVRQGGLVPLFMTMGRVGAGEKFCAVFRDITQWKKAEEELTEAKRQAERASSAKSDFLAKISHEIRTPLNAIIGFSEVMMAERFGPIGNERYREYLKDIHASGGHLLSLINDLLDLSKIEAGKMDLSFTGVTLNDVTHQCVAIMQAQANRERIIIRTSLSPKLPQIVADTRSVRQIVLNLLSNSIKFTQAGGQVIVSTALTDGGEVVLRVRDTGIGMSEEDITTALEPFRQLATSGRWGSGGTGLGLPLTKALAEANRAAFRIKSTPNAGTLVEITFPATRVLAQ
jgi:PAS domain S-box-containing protein